MAKWKFNRWRAAGLHLVISLAIAAALLLLMLELWFPAPLFEADGGNKLLFIVVGVDVVLGPLITLVVFRLGKPGLRFDLSVIAVAQLAALAYGLSIVYLARPAFIVFVVDQFQIARAVDLQPGELAKARWPQFRTVPVTGPLLAYADVPTEPQERTRLTFEALAGRDFEQFPRLYAPYEERSAQVLAKAWTLAKMRQLEPVESKVVDAYLARKSIREDDVRFVRLRARRAWVAVLIDAKTAAIRDMVITERIE